VDNNIVIRKAVDEDYPFLKEMLYESIHVPPGAEKPPLSIIEVPELLYYIKGWMKESDAGCIAEHTGKKIGAAWARVADDPHSGSGGYGYIDPATPELCIAVNKALTEPV